MTLLSVVKLILIHENDLKYVGMMSTNFSYTAVSKQKFVWRLSKEKAGIVILLIYKFSM